MNDNKLMLSERLLLCSVKYALTQSIHDPLFVSNEIIKNKERISMCLLKEIQHEIMVSILGGKIAPIDLNTWDKLYDEIEKLLEEAGV